MVILSLFLTMALTRRLTIHVPFGPQKRIEGEQQPRESTVEYGFYDPVTGERISSAHEAEYLARQAQMAKARAARKVFEAGRSLPPRAVHKAVRQRLRLRNGGVVDGRALHPRKHQGAHAFLPGGAFALAQMNDK
jgi:hypothetical protein